MRTFSDICQQMLPPTFVKNNYCYYYYCCYHYYKVEEDLWCKATNFWKHVNNYWKKSKLSLAVVVNASVVFVPLDRVTDSENTSLLFIIGLMGMASIKGFFCWLQIVKCCNPSISVTDILSAIKGLEVITEFSVDGISLFIHKGVAEILPPF